MTEIEIKDNVRDMMMTRNALRAEVEPHEWDAVIATKKADIKLVMAINGCDVISATELIVGLLETNLALTDSKRAGLTAFYAFAAAEMQGPEFIESLKQV